MGWVKFNVSERRTSLSQVLQHVRLPLLNPKYLVGTVGSDLLVKSDEACRDLVDEAKNYLLLPQERLLMQGPRTKPRKPIRRGEVLFAGNNNSLILYLITITYHYHRYNTESFLQVVSF
jgi:kelch-like protein 20